MNEKKIKAQIRKGRIITCIELTKAALKADNEHFDHVQWCIEQGWQYATGQIGERERQKAANRAAGYFWKSTDAMCHLAFFCTMGAHWRYAADQARVAGVSPQMIEDILLGRSTAN